MTATRSPILIASSMSWVTNMIVFASSSWRRRNSFWRRSRTIGSTAPNGSSISMIGGSAARARATPTRCRSPPLSWDGKRSRYFAGSRPTSDEQLLGPLLLALARPAEQPRDGDDVLADRLVREQPDLLDDVADAPPQLDDVALGDVLAVDEDLAARRLDEPVDHLQARRLAAAGRPDEDADLAGGHGQAEVVDGAGGVLRARVVALRDVAELDGRRPRGRSGLGRHGRRTVRHVARGRHAPTRGLSGA